MTDLIGGFDFNSIPKVSSYSLPMLTTDKMTDVGKCFWASTAIDRGMAMVNTMSSMAKGVMPKRTKTEEQVPNESREVKKAKQLCNLLKVINFLRKLTNKIGELIQNVLQIAAWCIEKITTCVETSLMEVLQWITAKVQLLVLYIKQLLLWVKIKIAKLIRKVLKGITFPKGSWLSTALAGAVNAVLTAFKALSTAIGYILQGVLMIVEMIPPIICVGAENMCFFFTPRSIINGQMKVDILAANPNLSITDRLPTPIKLSLAGIVDATEKSNAVLKYSIIAAGAAMGIAAISSDGEFKLDGSVCKALQLLDPKKIIQLLETILKAFAAPYALPKYEELSPTTLGYLAFLMTGFCPSGHIAFGFPFCP